MDTTERYEVFLRVADSDDDDSVYMIEHWFSERPAIETIAALFEEAKHDFAELYPSVEPEHCSVQVSRLRPADDHRPAVPRG